MRVFDRENFLGTKKSLNRFHALHGYIGFPIQTEKNYIARGKVRILKSDASKVMATLSENVHQSFILSKEPEVSEELCYYQDQ